MGTNANIISLFSSLERRLLKFLDESEKASNLRIVFEHDQVIIASNNIKQNLEEMKTASLDILQETSQFSADNQILRDTIKSLNEKLECLNSVVQENKELKSLLNQTSYSERFVDSSLKGKLVQFSDIQKRTKLKIIA